MRPRPHGLVSSSISIKDEINATPSGPGPTAEFISLLSYKETNQRNSSLAGGFFVRLILRLLNFRLLGNRLESIAVRRCSGFGWSVFEVAGSYVGSKERPVVSQRLGIGAKETFVL